MSSRGETSVPRLEPHRGGLVLTLGILSWVISCPIFGIIAWVMGNGDINEMQGGRMDPSGQGMTQAGLMLGMIHSMIFIAGAVIAVFAIAFFAAAG